MGISIFSYDGGVSVSLQVEAGVIPDPDAIIAAYEREVDALRQLAPRPRSRRRRAGSTRPVHASHVASLFSHQPPTTTVREYSRAPV